MPRVKARSSSAWAASSFSMEQKRVPEPKPMQETSSPVLPRRRFGNELEAAARVFSAVPSTTAAVVVLRNWRRDQPDFMLPPLGAKRKLLAKLIITQLPVEP